MKNACIYICMLLLAACAEVPMQDVGLQEEYRMVRMTALHLAAPDAQGEWIWHMQPDRDTIMATGAELHFVPEHEGLYEWTFRPLGTPTAESRFRIRVVHEAIEYSPHIAAVLDYHPAPGQFINLLPEYEAGDTEDDMRRKAETALAANNAGLVSLGGFGGYLTFRFDHTIVNAPNAPDFAIYGNAFSISPATPQGSAEPGIVQVAFDTNGNGQPDPDEWYELAGSQTGQRHQITYHRPPPNKIPDTAPGYLDRTHIRYTLQGSEGHIAQITNHPQPYYPQWQPSDSLTFTATLLPPNGTDLSGTGNYYRLTPYEWGYADNHPNNDPQGTAFDIAHATDPTGHPVHLPGADFIRVHTAINQQCGWLGETSTELTNARDLHIP